MLEKALDPATAVVDGRTEKDFLRFMSDFASLINFFDQNNQNFGDWRPLILKDPVILLAYIATTKYDKKHNLLIEIAAKRTQIVNGKIRDAELTAMANTLLDLYVDVYRDIEQWTYYMKKHEHEHHFRKYLFEEVKKEYAPIIWALLQLRAFLHGTDIIKNVKEPRYYLFEDFDPKVWNDSINTLAFWQTLKIEYPLADNNVSSIFESLLSIGDNILGFYKNCVDSANAEFSNLNKVENRYPDTILVRVFAKLFKVYTDAMNGLSKNHLEFYYKDILKQKEKLAGPDEVFISIPLNSKTDPFEIQKGCRFKAGLNENKEEILFESLRNVTLNPGKIGDSYALFTDDGDTIGTKKLYQNIIPTPSKLQKDENGKLLSWPTFGEVIKSTTKENLAISIASPMFLMEDGERTITLTMTFQEKTNPWSILNANFYLSTVKEWLDVTDLINFSSYPNKDDRENPAQLKNVGKLQITINLDPAKGAIQPFKNNPDGYTTKWPLLKIEFSDFANLNDPPRLSELGIEVTASKMKSLVLENDHGKLSAKKPFEPLGPAPNINANFFIGSPEIFSKPFKQICLEMQWDALPAEFKDYYEAYNKYLKHYDIMDGTGSKKRPWIVRWLERIFGKIFKWNIGAFQYSNNSFLVEFGILQDGDWGDLEVESTDHTTLTDKKSKREKRIEKRALKRAKDGLYLFKEKLIGGLETTTLFNCPDPPAGYIPKPELQEQKLKFSESTSDGFVKMTLVNPGFGFGLDLYGKVVSYSALVNAKTIVSQIKIISSLFSSAKIKQAANKPYNPKLGSFLVTYDASHTYDLSVSRKDNHSAKDSNYPIQCFHYTPFEVFKTFDNSENLDDQICTTEFAMTAPLKKEVNSHSDSTSKKETTNVSLPIHIPFQRKGALIMGFENLVGNAELNLFFELRRKIGIPSTKASIEYSALTEKGWSKTPVILNETQDFICSGILGLNVPVDVSSGSVFMPQKKYWLSIGVDESISTFPETTYLGANGLRLKRSSSNYLQSSAAPKIAATKVTGTASAIPQLGTIVQPFSSFGGKKAEDERGMFKRVSSYLSSKGRVHGQTDYYRIVKQNFPEIFYAKAIYDEINDSTTVLLVRQISDITDPSAFMPLVSECTELRVQEFLSPIASAFSNIRSINFTPIYVSIEGTIVIEEGIATSGLQKTINERINLFLSPWIESNESQICIDSCISEAQVSNMLQTVEGVMEVNDISFVLNKENPTTSKVKGEVKNTLIQTSNSNELFVTGLMHQFKFRTE
ncbi:MAG: hypothetical protein ABJG36_05655 [Crocinitomicaceae bacterium]